MTDRYISLITGILTLCILGISSCSRVVASSSSREATECPVLSAGQIDSIVFEMADSNVTSGINSFAINMAKLVMENSEDNYIFSPLGIAFNLSMLSNGANGITKDEILTVLGVDNINNAQNRLNNYCRSVDVIINNPATNASARLANSLWVDEKHKIKKQFKTICKNKFHTGIFIRNLSSEATKDEINQWVSANTDGLIKNFLSHSLYVQQSSALINAIFVKAPWDFKFDHSLTSERYPFNNIDGTEGICKMMKAFNRTQETIAFDCFDIIRFTLASSTYGFDVILPHPDVDLKDCINQIDDNIFVKWKSRARHKTWDIVRMPKFDIRTTHSFHKSLVKLGLDHLFTDSDFSDMTPSKHFFISDILQKARFIVEEDGAEAAAATMDTAVGSPFGITEPRPKPTELILDRPFMYTLTDLRTNTIIFIGEVKKFPQ